MRIHPFDEPTTIDRHDVDNGNSRVPHRHKDTDLRPAFGVFAWTGFVALAVGLVLLGYYWVLR